MAKISPHVEQMPSRMRVVDIILPRPTSGDTMPPNRKPEAPKMADAVPTILRPSSIAIVVAEVRMKPMLTSIENVNISYGRNDGINR